MPYLGSVGQFNVNVGNWKVYQEQLEQFIELNRLNSYQKTSVLLSSIGQDAYEFLRNLCMPKLPKDKTFEELCSIMNDHFTPRTNVFRERNKFYEAKQRDGESVIDLAARIRGLSSACDFGDCSERILVDKFVFALSPGTVKDRVCEERPTGTTTLARLVDIAVANESSCAIDQIGPVDWSKNDVGRRQRGTRDAPANTWTAHGQQMRSYGDGRAQRQRQGHPSRSNGIGERPGGGHEQRCGRIDGRPTADCSGCDYRHRSQVRENGRANERRPERDNTDRRPPGMLRPLLPAPSFPVGLPNGGQKMFSSLQRQFSENNAYNTGIWKEGGLSLPIHAVRVGTDKDGQSLYAGRAYHENDLLPAKINPTHSSAYVCWGGLEHAKPNYEVLCDAIVTWVSCNFYNIPLDAIVIGSTKNGEKLYMGRARYNGTLSPGKIQPSHKTLYIPYNGKEVAINECEIMIYNHEPLVSNLGIMIERLNCTNK